jgi:hypothetical protein
VSHQCPASSINFYPLYLAFSAHSIFPVCYYVHLKKHSFDSNSSSSMSSFFVPLKQTILESLQSLFVFSLTSLVPLQSFSPTAPLKVLFHSAKAMIKSQYLLHSQSCQRASDRLNHSFGAILIFLAILRIEFRALSLEPCPRPFVFLVCFSNRVSCLCLG